MKTITLSTRSKHKLLHIEAPGCIVNIHIGLTDADGRMVTKVGVSADGSRYASEPEWWCEGESGNGEMGVRVVCTGTPEQESAP